MDIRAFLDSVVNDRIEKSTNVHYENMQNYKGQKENFPNVMKIYRNKTRKRTDQLSVRIQLIEGLFMNMLML
jgi:hypothetical protein